MQDAALTLFGTIVGGENVTRQLTYSDLLNLEIASVFNKFLLKAQI